MPLDSTDLGVLARDLKTATDEVKGFAEKVNTEMKNLGDATRETKAGADEALIKMNELSARVNDVEQRVVRRSGGGNVPEAKSIGQRVMEHEATKALLERKSGQARITIDLKEIVSGTGVWGSTASPTNSLVVPDRQALVMPGQRTLTIRDLLMPGQTTSNSIEYPVETDSAASTAAAVVSEGQLKPQSSVAFDLRTAPVRTIAHYVRASRQILDDAPQLQSYIDGRLRYGLGYVEENELLFGDGTNQHILGIASQATAYSAAFTPTSVQGIDTIRLGILQATLAFYPPSGIVMHPTDWAKIELSKDSTNQYLIGSPQGGTVKRLWTLPVVDTPAMTLTKFLVGAFGTAAQIFDRLSMEVLISTEDQDNFVRNFVTIRAEERLSLAVYRPAAFIYGTLP